VEIDLLPVAQFDAGRRREQLSAQLDGHYDGK
jgi:hypothetical protein